MLLIYLLCKDYYSMKNDHLFKYPVVSFNILFLPTNGKMRINKCPNVMVINDFIVFLNT